MKLVDVAIARRHRFRDKFQTQNPALDFLLYRERVSAFESLAGMYNHCFFELLSN